MLGYFTLKWWIKPQISVATYLSTEPRHTFIFILYVKSEVLSDILALARDNSALICVLSVVDHESETESLQ